MIKFINLHKINNRYKVALKEAFEQSLDTSQFILGANVLKFENEFANYSGTNHCIGTASGLDALTLILKGYIEIGKLKKGDKIIIPSNTFIATILSVLHAELEPVFVEPDIKTYNLSATGVKTKLSMGVKGIVMVHLYGQLADVIGLKKLAKENNLLLIEDAAQAHGAQLTVDSQNFKAGNLGAAAAFSFYPSKNLGALGDGGAITTNDNDLYNVVKLLRNYGSKEKYKNKIIGFNSRLDDIQAAFLSVKLKSLDADNLRRQVIARMYLAEVKNDKIKLPYYDGSNNHVFYAFVVEVDLRDNFVKYLDDNAIGWLIHYPIPPHKQDALHRFSNLKLSLTEQIHKRVISLPISPVMTDDEVKIVINVLNNY